MNKTFVASGIVVSVGLAYASLFTIQYAFGAILLGIPLMVLGKKYSGIAGFLIGLVSSLTIYLLYPLSSVSELGGIVQQIIGIPSLALIVLFPLMYGLIGAVSALLFTGIREYLEPKAALTPQEETGKQ